jgi:hypothetical protein
METLIHFYLSIFLWVAFAPIIIVFSAIFVTLKMSKHKWITHLLTFTALLLTMPVYIWIGGILDPSTIEYQGPGDGFVVLFYYFNSLPAVIIYATYAWLTRRRSRVVASST